MTFFKRIFTKVTRNTLNSEFSKEQTEALIKDMWQRYNQLSPDLPESISPTGKFLMETSGADLALFYTLVSHGIEEGVACQIIADVNWSGTSSSRCLPGKKRICHLTTASWL